MSSSLPSSGASLTDAGNEISKRSGPGAASPAGEAQDDNDMSKATVHTRESRRMAASLIEGDDGTDDACTWDPIASSRPECVACAVTRQRIVCAVMEE
jgi:hypothetical protein